MISWTPIRSILLVLVGTVLLASTTASSRSSAGTAAQARLMEPAHYLLEDIFHGPTWPTSRRIGSVEAEAEWGQIHLVVGHSPECRETYDFRWDPEGDIRRLEAGERFKVTANALLQSADCYPNADPYMSVHGNLESASEILKTRGVATGKIYKGSEGSSGNVYVKGGPRRGGPRETWLEMPSQIPNQVPYVWFAVTVHAPSPNAEQLVNYEAVYLYRAQFSFR